MKGDSREFRDYRIDLAEQDWKARGDRGPIFQLETLIRLNKGGRFSIKQQARIRRLHKAVRREWQQDVNGLLGFADVTDHQPRGNLGLSVVHEEVKHDTHTDRSCRGRAARHAARDHQ